MRYKYTCPKGHDYVDNLGWDTSSETWRCSNCASYYPCNRWKCEELVAPYVTTSPPSPRNPTLVEREATHGDFEQTAQIAQDLKCVLRAGKNYSRLSFAQTEAIDLICTKLARIVCGNPNEPDHWKDIAGYANLGEEACKNKDYRSMPCVEAPAV